MSSPLQSFRLRPAMAVRLDAWGLKQGIASRGTTINAILARFLDSQDTKPQLASPRPTGRRGLTTGLLR